MSRIPDSTVVFTDLRANVDSNFWQSVLKTPVSQLGSKLESAQQETFRCQHEMLEQISQKQSQFTTGIKTGTEYFRQKQQIQSRLSGLTNLHKSFTASLSRDQFVQLGSTVTAKSDPPSAEATWPKLLTRTPKTLEDLEQLSILTEKVELQAKDPINAESALLSQNAAFLKSKVSELNQKHFATCLAKALAPVPVSVHNWKNVKVDLERIWKIAERLEGVPDKNDIFFALLLNKTSTNTIGQSAEGPAVGSHYWTALENLIGSAEMIVWMLRYLASKSEEIPSVSLHPSTVSQLQERVCFLVGQLAKESKLVPPSMAPPLVAQSQIAQVLRDCFKVQVLEVLSIARAQQQDSAARGSESCERTAGYLTLLVSQYRKVLGSGFKDAVDEIETVVTELAGDRAAEGSWSSIWTSALEASQKITQSADSPVQNGKQPDMPDEEEEETGTHVILDEDDEDEDN